MAYFHPCVDVYNVLVRSIDAVAEVVHHTVLDMELLVG